MVTASRFHGNQREDGSQAPCCPHAGPRCGRKRPFASLGSQKRPCHGPKDSSPPPGSLGDAGERLPCARLQETDGHCHYPSWWGGRSERPLLAGVLHSVFCWLHPRAHRARGCGGHRPPRPGLPAASRIPLGRWTSVPRPPEGLLLLSLLCAPPVPSLGPLQAACHLATITNFLETKSHTSRK